MPPSRTRIACVYVSDLVYAVRLLRTIPCMPVPRNLRPRPGFAKDRNRSIARRQFSQSHCLRQMLDCV